MATGPERSKPLHNFSLPCLKWGTQRLLRCVNADHRRSSRFHASQNSKRKIIIDDDIREEANSAAIMIMMPWNLRTRRAAFKAPPPPQNQDHPTRLFDIEKKKVTVATTANNNDKVKFSVSLSKEEVEQDFWALFGARPPRRPKKRPRIVQRQLNTLFPGLWLAEISAESYKVADVPE